MGLARNIQFPFLFIVESSVGRGKNTARLKGGS
ncbi:MAG: hypothetical protein CM15mP79_1370 [Methanobacteriota archaeon]|nr:MAG: hypothetical protein CM15mP79_1370 [Euryarchaeota archaeon]